MPASLGIKGEAGSFPVVMANDVTMAVALNSHALVNLPVNLVDDGGDAITTLPVSGPLTDTQLRATAVPVSGTITANAGTGTLAVSAASLPLPTGAATAAKQPALGTAGTSSADVLTVQGRASMTPLLVDGSATTQPVSGTVGVTGVATSAKQDTIIGHVDGIETVLGTIDADTSNLNDTVATLGTTTYTEATTKGQIVGAVRRDADTTLVNTTNEVGPLQMDANGRLKVEAFSGETLPVSGTVAVTGVATETTLAAASAKLPATLGQKAMAASLPVVIASDQSVLDVQLVQAAAVSGDILHDSGDSGPPLKIGGYAKAAAPTDVSADADRVNAWFLRNGAQATVVTAGGALVGGDATNGLDVDVTRLPALVASSANIGDVDVLTIAAGDNNIGNVDIVTMPNVTIGTMAALVAGSAAIGKLAANSGIDIGDVDITSIIPGTGATNQGKAVDAVAGATDTGTAVLVVRDDVMTTLTPVDGDYVSLRVDSVGRLWTHSDANQIVVGNVAHDSTDDSTGPVKIGTRAASALPTAVAADDRANAIGDLFGRILVSHIDPAMQTTKAFNATTTQTGIDVWDPASGKKIAITALIVGTYGTTAGRMILWFGDNADTTYSAGTDQVLAAASFAPSATAKPGLVLNFDPPIFCTTADRELHITTDAALSIDVTVHGYEW